MSSKFPFTLEDLVGWTVRRKDGVVVRYNLVDPTKTIVQRSVAPTKVHYPASSMSAWCDHMPHPDVDPPIFEASSIGLWIADAFGARKVYHEFDVAIDGGGVLPVPGEHDLPNIYGDKTLRKSLERYVYAGEGYSPDPTSCRILKLRWTDRAAPPVMPKFWPKLLEELKKIQESLERPLKVLTICQGGHGRSGSALAILMMCLSDYTPLDALTHIRALHCARAIESQEQHVYLNLVAELLGREQNALEAEKVSSFKQRFLDSTHPTMVGLRDRITAGKGAKVESRSGLYL